jgi:hypothetical protein
LPAAIEDRFLLPSIMRCFIADAMKESIVDAEKRDGKLVAHLSAHGATLYES